MKNMIERMAALLRNGGKEGITRKITRTKCTCYSPDDELHEGGDQCRGARGSGARHHLLCQLHDAIVIAQLKVMKEG